MDDDATTKSQLRHRWKDEIEAGTMTEAQWPRTEKGHKKQDKGKLELFMIAPRVIADPTHRKKVFRSALYLLKERTKSKPLGERCTDRDILKLSTYWARTTVEVSEKRLQLSPITRYSQTQPRA